MKMLSEDEICKLCKETQQKTVNYLAESERKKTERMAAFRASQEKQYQHEFRTLNQSCINVISQLNRKNKLFRRLLNLSSTSTINRLNLASKLLLQVVSQ